MRWPVTEYTRHQEYAEKSLERVMKTGTQQQKMRAANLYIARQNQPIPLGGSITTYRDCD